MDLNATNIAIGSICLAGAISYVIARWKDLGWIAAFAKITASTAFVILGLVNQAVETPYGRLILVALFFSWVGDVLLLSLRSSLLLAGIGSFFVAHIVFAIAFTLSDLNNNAFIVTLAGTAILGSLVLKWLWKYLTEFFRIAVAMYLAAIAIMVSFAVAAGVESMPPIVGVAAILFAVSDISVAKDRFIERSIANKAWGIPLYYIAQVLFAASVIPAG